MISIAVNNQMLEVPNLTIPMEEVFSFDDFLSSPAEHSWKFTIPKTPHNRRVLGMVDVIDMQSQEHKYTCGVYVDGNLFKRGMLYLERDDEAFFDVYFVGDLGVFKDMINKRKINELNHWPDVTISNYRANATNLNGYTANFNGEKLNFLNTDNPAVFSVASDEYTIQQAGDYIYVVEVSLPVGQMLNSPELKLYESGSFIETQFFSGVDFFNGKYLFTFTRTYTAGQVGTTVDFRFDSAIGGQSSMVFNLDLTAYRVDVIYDYLKNNATSTTDPVVFFPVFLPKEEEGLRYFNRYDDTRKTSGSWEGFDSTTLNLFTPFVYLREFWQALEAEFDITVESAFLADAEIDSLVFFNTRPINRKNENGDFTNSIPNSFSTKNHVPNETIEKFLIGFALNFNLRITYNPERKTLYIEHRPDVLTQGVQALSGQIVSIQNLYEELKTYSFKYKLTEDEEDGFEYWSGTLQGITGPDGSDMLESDVSTLGMYDYRFRGETYMPECSVKIGEDAGMKLLFYRGLQNTYSAQNGNWGPAPHGSSDTQYTTGFNYALTWQTDSGLYAKWWQFWLTALYNARILRVIMKQSPEVLLHFNGNQLYQIESWKCLIRKRSYQLTNHEQVVEAEVIKL